jgi:hypothetical protein
MVNVPKPAGDRNPATECGLDRRSFDKAELVDHN